jgi:hypothetical protein
MNRGGDNIDYATGFEMEKNLNDSYLPILKDLLETNTVDFLNRSLLDKAAGIDAIALINNIVFGISLRYRNGDYKSFTLNRHITEFGSEASKWLSNSVGLKPTYHVQIAKGKNYYRVIRINILAFKSYMGAIDLEKHYNPKLKAYEFKLEDLAGLRGVYSKIYYF